MNHDIEQRGPGPSHDQGLELPHIKTPSRNSFDDSLDHPGPGQRSPGKVIAFIQFNTFSDLL